MLGCFALVALAGLAHSDEEQVVHFGELAAPDATAGDLFGSAVVLGELYSAVGAPGCAEVAVGSGAVYLFARSSSGWVQTQKLLPPEARGDERFGSALDLAGERLLVGAPGADGSVPNSGAAYLYRFDGQQWVLERKVAARDGASGEKFGCAVAFAGDELFLGASQRRIAGQASGAVFVFGLAGEDVGVARELRGHDTSAGDLFGWHLATDGRSLLVGAPGESSSGSYSGSSYVFERGPAGWDEVAKLTASNAGAGAVFGSSGAVAGDRLCVGAPAESTEQFLSGAVYLFRRGSEGWLEESLLKAKPVYYGARFGDAVELSQRTLVVGARLNPVPDANAGRVFVFRDVERGWELREEFGEPVPGFNHWYGATLDGLHGEFLVGAPHSSWIADNSGSAQAISVQPGSAFCAGDGSVAICPCGNFGSLGRGCANSGGSGALLYAEGSPRVSHDDLELSLVQAMPQTPVMLVASNQEAGGGQGQLLGDGLLCAGGMLRTLGLGLAGSGGDLTFDPELISQGADWSPGESRMFQVIYRDIAASPCNGGFNTSNGYRVDFEP